MVNALPHPTGFPVADRRARQTLQFEGHAFDDVPEPGALLQAPNEAPGLVVRGGVLAERGQQSQGVDSRVRRYGARKMRRS